MDFYSNKIINLGFTLAEILVTLAVIGVIASMTIPGIIQKVEDQKLRTAFKKTYAELNQATQRMVFENGGTTLGNCSANSDCVKDRFVEYLNVIKHCNAGKSYGNCWHLDDGNTRYLNGTAAEWGNHSSFILSNGSLVRMWVMDTCNDKTYSGKGSCGEITVDVNGFEKPNILGKDIFYIHLYSNGIAPWGVPDDNTNYMSRSSSCTKGQLGWGCAALALQDKDY